ncbi:MAG: hypothetical protein RR450_09980 [Oscillospiraceae bacterium]
MKEQLNALFILSGILGIVVSGVGMVAAIGCVVTTVVVPLSILLGL